MLCTQQFTQKIVIIIRYKYIIQIRNLLGQVVYNDKVQIQDSYKQNIDISSYGKGTYLISVSNNKRRLTEKIIIE